MITLNNNPIMNALNPNNIIDAEETTEAVATTETDTSQDSMTLKNYGGKLDPFMEVQKVENRFPDGTINPTCYSIRMEGLFIDNVSKKYLLVPNRELVDIGHEIMDKSGINF